MERGRTMNGDEQAQAAGVRFVVVATAVRGGLDAPELLDDANQWRVFSAWREDASRQVRTEFEMRYDDARVVWAKGGERGNREQGIGNKGTGNKGTGERFQALGVRVRKLARGAA